MKSTKTAKFIVLKKFPLYGIAKQCHYNQRYEVIIYKSSYTIVQQWLYFISAPFTPVTLVSAGATCTHSVHEFYTTTASHDPLLKLIQYDHSYNTDILGPTKSVLIS